MSERKNNRDNQTFQNYLMDDSLFIPFCLMDKIPSNSFIKNSEKVIDVENQLITNQGRYFKDNNKYEPMVVKKPYQDYKKKDNIIFTDVNENGQHNYFTDCKDSLSSKETRIKKSFQNNPNVLQPNRMDYFPQDDNPQDLNKIPSNTKMGINTRLLNKLNIFV
jgi:hypothetical protein